MSVQSHLEELKRKHLALDLEITKQQRAPGVDDLQLQALKKQKLRIKEQIQKNRRLAN